MNEKANKSFMGPFLWVFQAFFFGIPLTMLYFIGIQPLMNLSDYDVKNTTQVDGIIKDAFIKGFGSKSKTYLLCFETTTSPTIFKTQLLEEDVKSPTDLLPPKAQISFYVLKQDVNDLKESTNVEVYGISVNDKSITDLKKELEKKQSDAKFTAIIFIPFIVFFMIFSFFIFRKIRKKNETDAKAKQEQKESDQPQFFQWIVLD